MFKVTLYPLSESSWVFEMGWSFLSNRAYVYNILQDLQVSII